MSHLAGRCHLLALSMGFGFAAVALTVGCGNASDFYPTESVGQSGAAINGQMGVDYSDARPSPAGLKSGGYSFAVRYLSDPGNPKNLSASEAQALIAAGLDVVSNWEQTGMDASGSATAARAAGVSDATTANSQAAADGMPSGRPIYFSVDYDTSSADLPALLAYFDGVASVIGLARTGAYGGYYTISQLFDASKITFGWQAFAWSNGQWDTRAQLRQTQNDITAAGDAACCDLDVTEANDFGQWGAAAPAAYGASFVDQSFPLATTTLQMVTGQTLPSYIKLKNIGTKAWDSQTHLGTTVARDRASAFADSTWISPKRPSGVTGTVAPGATFKFTFDLHAPATPGDYDEHFGVTQEGVSWFGDPAQGGPPDNDLEVKIKVIAGDGGSPVETDAGDAGEGPLSPDASPGAGGEDGGGVAPTTPGDGGEPTTHKDTPSPGQGSNGCSIVSGHRDDHGWAGLALFALVIGGVASRKRRAR